MKIKLPEAEVQQYLDDLKSMLKRTNTKIVKCDNREKNFIFYYLYNIDERKIKEVLNTLSVNDFMFATPNDNHKYPNELLYVFGPKIKLYNAAGTLDDLELYIKLSLMKDRIITISFHEAEHSFNQGS